MKKLVLMLLLIIGGLASYAQVRGRVVYHSRVVHHRHYVHHPRYHRHYVRHRYHHRSGIVLKAKL